MRLLTSTLVNQSQSRYLSRFIIVVFSLSTLIVNSFVFLPECKAEPAPTLSATVLPRRLVNLQVVTSRKIKKSKVRLVLERAINANSNFQLVGRFVVNARAGFQINDQLSSGISQVRYRSRLIGGTRSRWSRAVLVNLPLPPATPSNPSEPTIEEPIPENPAQTKPDSSPSLPAGFSLCPQSQVQAIYELGNSVRQVSGVASLSEHPKLSASAQSFATKIAQRSSLSHDGWYENILRFGYDGSSFAQNIGYMSALSANMIFNGWMESEGHRQNILSGRFMYMGVGCVIDAKGYAWWVQDFGG